MNADSSIISYLRLSARIGFFTIICGSLILRGLRSTSSLSVFTDSLTRDEDARICQTGNLGFILRVYL